MQQGIDSSLADLRHVRGARIDQPWTIYHVRASTLDCRPWFARQDCAELFIRTLLDWRAKLGFKLFAFVVMPEHVHLVLMPTEVSGLSRIMMNLKRQTAWLLNQRLNRKGRFWRDDFFDHWARKREQAAKAIEYLHNNPIRRGLVKEPEEYPYSSWLARNRPDESPYQLDLDWF